MLNRFITTVFGINPRLILGVTLLIVLFGGGAYFLWDNRNYWKDTAYGWKGKYESEKAGHRRTIVALDKSRDSTYRYIALLAKSDKQASDAKTIAFGLKEERNQLIAQSDRNASAMSEREKEVYLLREYIANNTLGVGDTSNRARVTDAAVKTVDRNRINAEQVSKLETSVATRDAEINSLKAQNTTDRQKYRQGLATVRTGLVKVSESAEKKKKGGIWPLNIGKRKKLEEVKVEVKPLVETVSDLENELND